MPIWLVLVLTTGITTVEPVGSAVECIMKGQQAVNDHRADTYRCAIGNRPEKETRI